MKINVYNNSKKDLFEPMKLYQCTLEQNKSDIILCTQGKQTDCEFPGVVIESETKNRRGEFSSTFVKCYFVPLSSEKSIILTNPKEIKKTIKFKKGNYYELTDSQIVRCSAIPEDRLSFQTVDGDLAFDIDMENAEKIMQPFIVIIEFDITIEDNAE